MSRAGFAWFPVAMAGLREIKAGGIDHEAAVVRGDSLLAAACGRIA